MRTGWVRILMWLVVGMGGMVASAQEAATPEVVFVAPSENSILQDSVSIVVEGRNFQDLTTFGFADFFYETDSRSVHLGTDKNTFDGLSLSWDTSSVPDGAYRVRVEVTDLVNTKGEGSIAVFVNNHGNQSFTTRATQNLISAIEALARALDFPDNLNAGEAIGVIKANFESAVATLDAALEQTQSIIDFVPDVVAQDDPFLKDTPLFAQLDRAVRGTKAAIENLDLEAAQTALADVVVAVRALAQIRPNGADLSPFERVAEGIETAAAELDKLLQALGGDTGQSIDAALEQFLALSRQVVPDLRAVATALRQTDEAFSLAFSSEAAPIAVNFRADDLIHVRLDGVSVSAEVRLFNGRGDGLLTSAFETEWVWDGQDSEGTPVGAGTFFFTIHAPENGPDTVKTGQLVILP